MPDRSDATRPRTLLELAGAPPGPPLAESALVLIDIQYEYVDGTLALPGVAPAIAEASRLLARAREAGLPIVHVAHKGRPGGLFDRDARQGAIVAEVAPADGETVIEKGLPNSFAGTGLQDFLKGTGRSSLVIAGFMTHMCVSSTVRAALDLGYRSTVVAGATGTRDLPAPGGDGVVDAKALQAASLAALADRFATIVKSVDDLA